MRIGGLQKLTLLDYPGRGRLHGISVRLQSALPLLS